MTPTFGAHAARLVDDGWQPIPVRPSTKIPAVTNWQRKPSARDWNRWIASKAGCGIGLVCGNVIAIDIDVRDHLAAGRLEALAVALLGPTPLIRVGQAPKRILIYRVAGGTLPTTRRTLSVGLLEILGEGAFFVGFGVHPDTGEPYRWIGEGDPFDTPASTLPSVTPLQVEDYLAQSLRLFPARQISQQPVAGRSGRADVVKCSRTGLILDGRDEHLRACIWTAWRQMPGAAAADLATAAWREFSATADLTRPARDGRRSWAERDALAKAVHLLRKAADGAVKRIAKARGQVAPAGHGVASHEHRVAFAAFVSHLHDAGRLTATEQRVSAFMLERLSGDRFVDSVETISRALRISKPTVQRARRKLLELGLWKTARQLGNRLSTAPYLFALPKQAQAAETAERNAGGVSSVTPITRGIGLPDAGGHPPVSPPPPQSQPADPKLVAACERWSRGPMPEIVRQEVIASKRRLGLKLVDVAKAIGVDPRDLAGADRIGVRLRPSAIAALKIWILAVAVPAEARSEKSKQVRRKPAPSLPPAPFRRVAQSREELLSVPGVRPDWRPRVDQNPAILPFVSSARNPYFSEPGRVFGECDIVQFDGRVIGEVRLGAHGRWVAMLGGRIAGHHSGRASAAKALRVLEAKRVGAT